MKIYIAHSYGRRHGLSEFECDALFVADIPSWEGSGVQHEIDLAKEYNIPIYCNIEEIPSN